MLVVGRSVSGFSRFRVHFDGLRYSQIKSLAANLADTGAKRLRRHVPHGALCFGCPEVNQCLFHVTDYSGLQYLRKTKNYPLTKSASVFTLRA